MLNDKTMKTGTMLGQVCTVDACSQRLNVSRAALLVALASPHPPVVRTAAVEQALSHVTSANKDSVQQAAQVLALAAWHVLEPKVSQQVHAHPLPVLGGACVTGLAIGALMIKLLRVHVKPF